MHSRPPSREINQDFQKELGLETQMCDPHI